MKKLLAVLSSLSLSLITSSTLVSCISISQGDGNYKEDGIKISDDVIDLSIDDYSPVSDHASFEIVNAGSILKEFAPTISVEDENLVAIETKQESNTKILVDVFAKVNGSTKIDISFDGYLEKDVYIDVSGYDENCVIFTNPLENNDYNTYPEFVLDKNTILEPVTIPLMTKLGNSDLLDLEDEINVIGENQYFNFKIGEDKKSIIVTPLVVSAKNILKQTIEVKNKNSTEVSLLNFSSRFAGSDIFGFSTSISTNGAEYQELLNSTDELSISQKTSVNFVLMPINYGIFDDESERVPGLIDTERLHVNLNGIPCKNGKDYVISDSTLLISTRNYSVNDSLVINLKYTQIDEMGTIVLKFVK
ncbi:hypothetical protein [Spiroplasma endosymbiont of Labia minor]|uniref:hypothetical protein n=1 Tax=Spiroplasma endosymbiont of Labia minor TaxID=3066305 RepID=UPI0030CAA39E